jgi:hypothetical protein
MHEMENQAGPRRKSIVDVTVERRLRAVGVAPENDKIVANWEYSNRPYIVSRSTSHYTLLYVQQNAQNKWRVGIDRIRAVKDELRPSIPGHYADFDFPRTILGSSEQTSWAIDRHLLADAV